MTVKLFEIIYSKDKELHYAKVWAVDKDRAERKFVSRGEITSYDIRSVYELKLPEVKTVSKRPSKMTALEKFVKLPKYYNWLKQYDAGSEMALAKQIPLTDENCGIIDAIAKIIPIQRRYRGPRLRGGYMRECHKQDAQRVSIYVRSN
jgi:hypothetical protein